MARFTFYFTPNVMPLISKISRNSIYDTCNRFGNSTIIMKRDNDLAKTGYCADICQADLMRSTTRSDHRS